MDYLKWVFISAVLMLCYVAETMLFVPELSIMTLCDIKSYVLSFNFSHFCKSLSGCVGACSDS